MLLILDGKEVADSDGAPFYTWPNNSLISPAISPNGDRVAFYRASKGEQWAIVVNGKPGPSFRRSDTFPENLVFSPDSSRLAYDVVSNDQESFIVVDGHTIEAGKNATSGPKFSKDSQHILFSLTSQVFVDGEFGPKFDQVTEGVFSPDGKHVAYGARNGWGEEGHLIVEDHNIRHAVGLVYDRPIFSFDGKRIAYKAEMQGGQRVVAIDDKPGPEFDYITAGPVVREDRSLEYIAGKKISQNPMDSHGVVLYRVVVPDFG